MQPLQIVAATPPVEATLRILLNSVPYLIGCAVVRQPAGPDAVAAEVGRNPWLFDRRLTTLELPDDALPANRAVALDWPVPYQAEWVGVPPRLLISRLVFAERTVGVLLGTLITREPLSAQTREAMDLSCELIASAMAMHSAAVLASPVAATQPAAPVPEPITAAEPELAPAPPMVELAAPLPELGPDAAARIGAIAAQIATAVSAVDDARAIGRILRDAMNEVSEASAFAVALFHADRPEIAYRYKVVGVDAASAELGKQPVDDSTTCFAVRNAERWHAFDRSITVGVERRRVGVVQIPLLSGHDAFGVVTLQTFRDGGFAHAELELVAAIVAATSAGFERGLLRGDRVSASPEAGGIDKLLGISDARFAVSVDDRYNAIARACREARVVSAPTVHELVQPVHDWNDAMLVERLAGGGRSAVAPIIVNGDVVGALVAGPRAEDFGAAELDAIQTLVASAGRRLSAAWRAATLGGTSAIDVPADMQAARAEHVA